MTTKVIRKSKRGVGKKTLEELDETLGEILSGEVIIPTLKPRKRTQEYTAPERIIAHQKAKAKVQEHILDQTIKLFDLDDDFARMISNIYNSSLKDETKLKVILEMTIARIKGDKEAVEDIYYKLFNKDDQEEHAES
jgi:hypothetical protein